MQEVSVGGDEVPEDSWTADSSCRNKNLTALDRSHLFFKDLYHANDDVLLSGWQQFVQQDDGSITNYALAPDHVGHVWVWEPSDQAIPHAVELADKGYPVVLAFADHLYFDLTYTPSAWESGFHWAGNFLDTHAALSSILSAEEVLKTLPESKKQYIVGLEGLLWSENLMNDRYMEYMALPKITGLSEAAWASPSVTIKSGRVNWRSLAYRLCYDNNGILGYLHANTGFVYRGMPNGISDEIVGR